MVLRRRGELRECEEGEERVGKKELSKGWRQVRRKGKCSLSLRRGCNALSAFVRLNGVSGTRERGRRQSRGDSRHLSFRRPFPPLPFPQTLPDVVSNKSSSLPPRSMIIHSLLVHLCRRLEIYQLCLNLFFLLSNLFCQLLSSSARFNERQYHQSGQV